MNVEHFFDETTSTLTYVVWQEKDAVIIDPVLNYDAAGSTYDFESVNLVESFIKSKALTVHYILETHAHADHLSGSQQLKKLFPQAKVSIGQEITKVQQTFKQLFNLDNDFPVDGSQFDFLLEDGKKFQAGSIEILPIHTPGHTEACYSFLIEDCVFTGDALFMPDFGVARCDFPNGSAKILYQSVTEKLYTLPNETKVYTGHDYQPGGRELRYQSTIGESKECNIHINQNKSEAEFIKFRNERDSTLPVPNLLLPSVQVNIAAGRLPAAESNDTSYLKIPVTVKNG